ncbi:site-specific integrase [Haloterrigena salifodinae]|uniref:Site-specific integrase n=1 Tax=Haloterrigena salifodinae TaxID=2675099 RepID=A0A8T8DZG4_9EURY|nr:site-specific integrase [Haloterrigena salifodinae]QRV14889.1 site-specific integrase [Haloterrigena salifodinae]
MSDTIKGIPLIPNGTEQHLNQRQLEDYKSHRKEWLTWCLTQGKDPETATGYSEATMNVRHYRANDFYEWVWNDRGYTTSVTHEDANEYIREIALSDYAPNTKAHIQKALKTIFRWREYEFGDDPWDPEMTIGGDSGTKTDRDYLTKQERRLIREASLEYGSIPNYNSCSPTERDRYKGHLARRFDIPKEEIGLEHWERANGWKIPSLVFVSLDTGLRPVEVERATVNWVDTDAGVLRIPKDSSAKSNDAWDPVLSSRTAEMLDRWLEQRQAIPMYDDTDTLWLTTKGNPYNTRSLSYLIDKLCEVAGIATKNRQVTWYSIRRGLATGLIDESDLSTAKEQLRHKNIKTTARYDQSPPERRRDALDKLG